MCGSHVPNILSSMLRTAEGETQFLTKVGLCYIHGCHASVAEMLTGQAGVAGGLGSVLLRAVFQAVPWQSAVVMMPPVIATCTDST